MLNDNRSIGESRLMTYWQVEIHLDYRPHIDPHLTLDQPLGCGAVLPL